MPMTLAPDDPRLRWYGALSFERGEGWIKPWRIPFDQRLLFGKTSVDDMTFDIKVHTYLLPKGAK